MKRKITVDQLNELTEEQKQKLREWWKPQEYDVAVDFKFDNYTFAVEQTVKDLIIDMVDYDGMVPDSKREDCLPLLDIGQMIELLDNGNINELAVSHVKRAEQPYWEVFLEDYKEKRKTFEDNIDLCDALWQAVKQVLGV